MLKIEKLIERKLSERASELQKILNSFSHESDKQEFLDNLYSALYNIESYAMDSRMSDEQVGKDVRRIVSNSQSTI